MSTASELRRQVGRELAAQRELAGIKVTDNEAAAIVGSTRTLKRLEAGIRVRVTFVVIGRLAEYYGAPRHTRFELERIWRFVDDEIWAQPSHAVENSGWDAYLEFERLAVGVAQYETMVPPGLCQTEGFMRRLFDQGGESREDIPSLIEDRLARQVEFERRLHDGRVEWRVLLSEAVLHQGCDGEQLNRMCEMDELENVTIRYLPFAGGPYRLLHVPFSVLSFRNPEDPTMVYLENPYERRFYENNAAVGKFHQIIGGGIQRAKSLKEFQR
ncbi:helix-turn-helix transcriptional regulator [Glycomyces sp. NPDC049804]|uniref:helix-turn-helix domain-containing protein n=1 Tax=Glycomyces sp. NPDC049804 TaxID=3154363 RepID=UPI0034224BDE